MGELANGICIALIMVLVVMFGWWRARNARMVKDNSPHQLDRFTLTAIINFVKNSLHELSRNTNNTWGMSEELWERRVKARTRLRQALRSCTFGDVEGKRFVKSYIRDLLIGSYGMGEAEADQVIPFRNRSLLTVQDRFEILLYLYGQKYGNDALSSLITDYELDVPRQSGDDSQDSSSVYEISEEDINMVFFREYRILTFEEKLDIIVQRIYQSFKGFSVVDMIREQRIDGVSGGVSGTIVYGVGQEDNLLDEDGRMRSYTWDSVWIFFQGKSIRLSFLSFGSEAELKRLCQNMYKYNYPGQLSEANGFKVNEMMDGSRVVVVRPPFAESWAFFVRKFDVKTAVLEGLIQGENADLPIQMLKFLMKGSRITAITGSQGSGKTTLLMAMVKHIYASYTLRVQEMSFELNLRKMYSSRNILSFRETNYVSGQAGLDLQKKTDGTVHILGEIATDEVAAWMIQMSQVASLFTVFTHHAKTFRDLIDSLRNSLLKAGVFSDESVAEIQVAGVIDFDVHLRRDIHGNRYIERITECCRIDDPTNTRSKYEENVIIEYQAGKYVSANPISSTSVNEMTNEMIPEDSEKFRKFLEMYWREYVVA
ncbi:Type II/IV secretion system protein [compost metagenome]